MGETVIILQEEGILAAEGKAGRRPELLEITRIPVEGYGDPYEQWRKALEAYAADHKPSPVRLILPPSYSSMRVTWIPYASGKQLSRMAENVVQESMGEGTADYAVIEADKKQGVCLCCGGVENAVLTKMQTMCADAGIPVKRISVEMEGYLRMLGDVKEYRSKTAIFLMFGENSVTSILFKEGKYLYSARSRIFSERGTLDFGTEIVRNISGILQFYATTKSATPITDIYYAGCSDDDFEVSLTELQNMGLDVQPLTEGAVLSEEYDDEDWAALAGALITDKKKELNLNQIIGETDALEELKKSGLLKQLIWPIVVLVLCLLVTIGMLIWNLTVSNQISKVMDWIQDDTVQEQYYQAELRKQENEKLTQSRRQLAQMKQNLSTYPELTDAKIRVIEDVSGSDMDVRIQSMDLSTGTLTFNAVSRQVIDIPGYIEKLSSTGLFLSVDYTGYNFEDGEYTLALTCVMKGADTEEGGEE